MRAGNRFEVPESRAPRSPRAAPSALPSMVNYSDSRRPVFLSGLHRFQQSQLHFGNDQTQRDVRRQGARQARASSVQRVLSFKRPFKWPSRGKDVSANSNSAPKILAYLLQTSFHGETSALLMRSEMNDFPLSIGASRRIER